MKRQYTVKVSFEPSDNFTTFSERLNLLVTDKKTLERLVKMAMVRTVVAAVRKRFLAGLPQALKMTTAEGSLSRPGRPSRELERNMRDSLQALSTAQADGTKSKIEAAQARVSRNQARYERALDPKAALRRNTKGRKSTMSRMIEGAMQVLNTATELSTLEQNKKTLAIGMGSMEELNAIKTPTANRNRKTTSKMNILWRHLEYGTGVLAMDTSINKGSRFKVRGGDGEWWWGPKRGQGVLVRGSAPLNAFTIRPTESRDLVKELKGILTESLLN